MRSMVRFCGSLYRRKLKIISALLDGRMGVKGYWSAVEPGFYYGTC